MVCIWIPFHSVASQCTAMPWQIDHAWRYTDSLVFRPISVLVDKFLGTRRARTQTSNSVPAKWPSFLVRPLTTGPLPIKLKFLYAYYEQTTLLVNTASDSSTFHRVDLPGILMLSDDPGERMPFHSNMAAAAGSERTN